MLGRNYISINGNQIPTPVGDLDISITDIENEKQSEAGTDLVSVTRLGKRVFSFTLQLTSNWKARIKNFAELPACELTFDGETISGRLRASSYKLIENSNLVENTSGLWIVSLTFKEV